jgi:hypothetical protein
LHGLHYPVGKFVPVSQACILIYGRDRQLLETRRMILGRSGANVWTAAQLADFDQIAPSVSINLIVLCHSLSMEDCGRGLALAHTRWPQIQSVAMISGPNGYNSKSLDRIVEAARGPAYLLQTVTMLLSRTKAPRPPMYSS